MKELDYPFDAEQIIKKKKSLRKQLLDRETSDYRGSINFINRLSGLFYGYIDNHESIYVHDIAFEQADYGIREMILISLYPIGSCEENFNE